MSGEDSGYFSFEKTAIACSLIHSDHRLVAQNRVTSKYGFEPKGSCSVRLFSSLFLSKK